ncbi:MAG: IclR family transcriptional regulator [Haloferacaceae archaeon]
MAQGRDDEPGYVKTTETSFAIIEQLRDAGGATVTDLAERLDLSKSTVHSHLRTLRHLGYVVEENDSHYLGLKFLDLGDVARARRNLYEVSKREMDELVSTVNEHGYVMVEELNRGVYIYQSTTERAVQTDSHIGTTVDLHATAVGKAYLAHLSADKRADLLDQLAFQPRTESTITDRERFEEELATVREEGVAFNDEERFVGMRAVGAPVPGPDDETLAAISVAGPTTRLDGERYHTGLPEMVEETAHIIGLRATYS